MPLEALITGDFKRCHLVPGLVSNYKDKVKLEDGMKVLELLTMKVILDFLPYVKFFSIFLEKMLFSFTNFECGSGTISSRNREAKRMAGVKSSMASKDRRIVELEAEIKALLKERDDAKREATKARDDLDVAEDEVEEKRLELLHKTSEFKNKLAEVKNRAWEEFKTSKDCDKIKGEYASGAYLHAFKEAQALLRVRGWRSRRGRRRR